MSILSTNDVIEEIYSAQHSEIESRRRELAGILCQRTTSYRQSVTPRDLNNFGAAFFSDDLRTLKKADGIVIAAFFLTLIRQSKLSGVIARVSSGVREQMKAVLAGEGIGYGNTIARTLTREALHRIEGGERQPEEAVRVINFPSHQDVRTLELKFYAVGNELALSSIGTTEQVLRASTKAMERMIDIFESGDTTALGPAGLHRLAETFFLTKHGYAADVADHIVLTSIALCLVHQINACVRPDQVLRRLGYVADGKVGIYNPIAQELGAAAREQMLSHPPTAIQIFKLRHDLKPDTEANAARMGELSKTLAAICTKKYTPAAGKRGPRIGTLLESIRIIALNDPKAIGVGPISNLIIAYCSDHAIVPRVQVGDTFSFLMTQRPDLQRPIVAVMRHLSSNVAPGKGPSLRLEELIKRWDQAQPTAPIEEREITAPSDPTPH